MQISFVMLSFLLFPDQISGGQKSLRGANCLRRGVAPCLLWKKARRGTYLANDYVYIQSAQVPTLDQGVDNVWLGGLVNEKNVQSNFDFLSHLVFWLFTFNSAPVNLQDFD